MSRDYCEGEPGLKWWEGGGMWGVGDDGENSLLGYSVQAMSLEYIRHKQRSAAVFKLH